MSLFTTEPEKFVVTQLIVADIWESHSDEKKRQLAFDAVVGAAHRSEEVAAVLEDSFEYWEVDAAAVGVPIHGGPKVVVRSTVMAYPKEGYGA